MTRRAERLHCTLQARFRVPIGSGADLALGAQADADDDDFLALLAALQGGEIGAACA